jgi:hypothetical protein
MINSLSERIPHCRGISSTLGDLIEGGMSHWVGIAAFTSACFLATLLCQVSGFARFMLNDDQNLQGKEGSDKKLFVDKFNRMRQIIFQRKFKLINKTMGYEILIWI